MIKKHSKPISNIVIATLIAIGSAFATYTSSADGVPFPVPIHTKEKCPCAPNHAKHYVSTHVGYSWPAEKLSSNYAKKPDGNVVLDIGIGHRFSEHFRTEVAAYYRWPYKYSATRNGYNEKQEITNTALMLNGYFDIYKFKKLRDTTPYVMGGIGYGINKAGNLAEPSGRVFLGDTTTNFVWQIGAGSLFKLTDYLYADIMYRYADLGEVKMKAYAYRSNNRDSVCRVSVPTAYLKVHELTLGIVYKFC